MPQEWGKQRRAVRGMIVRWQQDLDRLESLFGAYGVDDYSPGAEIQRNLGTAVAHAAGFLNMNNPNA